MTTRANYFTDTPEAMKILMQQETYLACVFEQSNLLNQQLWELVKLRVSLLNQCAFCVDMHTDALLQAGETPLRLVGLSSWRTMPYYNETERVLLNWAELVTAGESIDDSTYATTEAFLGSATLINATIAINAINSWNRIAKTFKPEIGILNKKRD